MKYADQLGAPSLSRAKNLSAPKFSPPAEGSGGCTLQASGYTPRDLSTLLLGAYITASYYGSWLFYLINSEVFEV